VLAGQLFITEVKQAQHFDMLANPSIIKARWQQSRIMPLSKQMPGPKIQTGASQSPFGANPSALGCAMPTPRTRSMLKFFYFIAVDGAQPLADQLHQAMSGRAARQ